MVARIRTELRSGAVCVNDVVVHVAGEELPFGGTGASGMGRNRGVSSFGLFTRERVIVKRALRWEISARFPSLPPLKVLENSEIPSASNLMPGGHAAIQRDIAG
ncbi:aldehyde dehydrogenase family protein [Luteolibacter yonseiensis]|uniref:Aldehyde dehydrogenase family protein n=1 Tax=Luteolibacter yonseiensis TaxID=1144680 RepID=A0A934R984_9BACT|nr:aldehyde dehydrogenase family protein [Luteolibacter yonseiensis]